MHTALVYTQARMAGTNTSLEHLKVLEWYKLTGSRAVNLQISAISYSP